MKKKLLLAVAVLILLGSAGVLRYVIFAPTPSRPLSVEAATPAKSAAPGEFITQVFTVRNRSDAKGVYQLESSAPQDWKMIGSLEPLALAPEQVETVFVTLHIPVRASAGNYQASLQAEKQGDPGISAESKVSIRVKAIPLPQVEPCSPRAEAEAGRKTEVCFRVANQGNVHDTFDLRAFPPPGWKVQVPQRRLELVPGESREVGITVSIPADAPPQVERVALRVIAEGYEAEAVVKVTVMPY